MAKGVKAGVAMGLGTGVGNDPTGVNKDAIAIKVVMCINEMEK